MDEILSRPSQERSGDFPYFRRTWNTVVVTLLAAAFVPLIIIGGGMYTYLTAVIKQKTVATLRVNALDLKNAVDQFLAERTARSTIAAKRVPFPAAAIALLYRPGGYR
ncbi:MAG: hypothetical protein P8X90_09310 [Desulfobacterales bacterium]